MKKKKTIEVKESIGGKLYTIFVEGYKIEKKTIPSDQEKESFLTKDGAGLISYEEIIDGNALRIAQLELVSRLLKDTMVPDHGLFSYYIGLSGLKAKEWAEKLGVTPSNISQIRRNKYNISKTLWYLFRREALDMIGLELQNKSPSRISDVS